MNEGFKLNIILVNPMDPKKVYNCPCIIPQDSLNMSEIDLDKSYGKHLTKALYDLLHHKPFRKALEKPKLILSS